MDSEIAASFSAGSPGHGHGPRQPLCGTPRLGADMAILPSTRCSLPALSLARRFPPTEPTTDGLEHPHPLDPPRPSPSICPRLVRTAGCRWSQEKPSARRRELLTRFCLQLSFVRLREAQLPATARTRAGHPLTRERAALFRASSLSSCRESEHRHSLGLGTDRVRLPQEVSAQPTRPAHEASFQPSLRVAQSACEPRKAQRENTKVVFVSEPLATTRRFSSSSTSTISFSC
jgi:hypothetical protein